MVSIAAAWEGAVRVTDRSVTGGAPVAVVALFKTPVYGLEHGIDVSISAEGDCTVSVTDGVIPAFIALFANISICISIAAHLKRETVCVASVTADIVSIVADFTGLKAVVATCVELAVSGAAVPIGGIAVIAFLKLVADPVSTATAMCACPATSISADCVAVIADLAWVEYAVATGFA
ncbi:MAG: hypothetical protein Tsb0020_06160 [Haliangiales bacterium]